MNKLLKADHDQCLNIYKVWDSDNKWFVRTVANFNLFQWKSQSTCHLRILWALVCPGYHFGPYPVQETYLHKHKEKSNTDVHCSIVSRYKYFSIAMLSVCLGMVGDQYIWEFQLTYHICAELKLRKTNFLPARCQLPLPRFPKNISDENQPSEYANHENNEITD